jgi:hypothetical protein
MSTSTTTTSTLRWSSKFTLAKGNENRDPFHEWSGSFALGNKKDIDFSKCAFHQIEGIFNAHFEESNVCTKLVTQASLREQKTHESKVKKNHADDASRILPEAKRRRKNSIDPRDTQRRQWDANHILTPS